MTIRWEAEACDLEDDPVSGAPITRLTSRVMSNINIYCEQPYCTPDGNLIAYTRASTPDPRVPPYALGAIDLTRLRTTLIDPEVASYFIGTSSWSGLMYYLRPNGELICVDLATLEKQIIITHWELPMTMNLDSVSPDHRYLAGIVYRPETNLFNVIRVDLKSRDYKIIYQSEETLSHLQFNPVHGRDIMIQINKGQRFDPKTGHWHHDNISVTHIYIDVEGNNFRPLPLGPPYTASTCGHAAWISDTGRIGVAVAWKNQHGRFQDLDQNALHDDRHPNGNFIVVGPDDKAPTVFTAPEHLFNHVNVSKCGQYFVCDSYRKGFAAMELVVGNIRTGKYRTLVSNCGGQGGGAASTHPHAYFTTDNRHVIYNADPHHVCHVYKARVTDEFMESLE